MRIYKDQFQLSASDLAKHLACRHLTFLDLASARGELRKHVLIDPYVVALEQRGLLHEGEYLNHLRDRGLEVLRHGEHLAEEGGLDRTIAAMKRGISVIAQADLNDGQWRGRADVLLRVDYPSGLGEWSYEVVDTKLAQETKGGTILQLCLYSELVERIQGLMPKFKHVVSPGNNFQPESFRLQDYLAYYRYVKRRLEGEVDVVMKAAERATQWVAPTEDAEMAGLRPPPTTPDAHYPEPVEYCELCDWWIQCNERRRQDDHLSFVAGISKLQIGELGKWDIKTLANLAEMPIPLKQKPDRGSHETYVRIREQARLQLQRRNTGNPIHELLALDPESGLARLPEPSAGDIFLDFESDPFVQDGGLEYLLGYATLNDPGDPQYTALWALHRSKERRAFETFIDFVMNRIQQYPELHIYHFSPYEPSALKRLMGRYASREDEIDQLLRGRRFVDLYAIVKQSLRASVEKYSLKDLELFFGFQRQIDLKDVRKHKSILECALELNDIYSIPKEAQNIVEDYNRDDCISTLRLRNWLESIREEQVRAGKEISRPPLEPGEPSEEVDENRKLVLALMERLLQDVPEDPAVRSPEQHAKWLLAHMLEYHRREEKVVWWEYFRLKELTDEELLDQRYAISGLQFVARVGNTKKCAIDQYRFPPQDMEVREGDELETSTGPFGDVETIDITKGIVDVKKRMAMTNVHPVSVFVHKMIRAKSQKAALLRIGTWVVENSVDGEGPYRAGRDLLLGNKPRVGTSQWFAPGRPAGSPLQIVLDLDHSVLPIQGPPGAGKTWTGARMICALLRAGKKVGITAVSHKVIRKLCEEVVKAAQEENLTVHGIQKVSELSAVPNPSIAETEDNAEVLAALNNGEAQFAAGTAWMWARPEFAEAVDVLFVDEAGQMSLPEVIAVSQAAKSIVMLRDPQQLEQPLQGTHPPGVAESALQHILGDHKTMPPEAGLFLDETWRLSPAICQFTSELFYENRLKSRDGCELRRLTGSSRFAGSGLFYVPAIHDGNQNSSNEEADAVAEIVRELLDGNTSSVNSKGETHRLELQHILIVAPYNAQVFELAKRLPDGARIGTVDKFQGQEAPVVIYSMTTSSPEEAPHGMEFLYSLNRFNVATSRAKCVCILVASPRLFEPECKSPHQMKLANVLCRYLELAKRI